MASRNAVVPDQALVFEVVRALRSRHCTRCPPRGDFREMPLTQVTVSNLALSILGVDRRLDSSDAVAGIQNKVRGVFAALPRGVCLKHLPEILLKDLGARCNFGDPEIEEIVVQMGWRMQRHCQPRATALP